jgi:hypothetical protein
MKHQTDLFWIPKNPSNEAIHWHFDDGYSVTQREQIPCNMVGDIIRKTFESGDGNLRDSEPTTDFTFSSGIDHIEKPSHHRQFLAFPDGFWSDLRATESQVPVIWPIGHW